MRYAFFVCLIFLAACSKPEAPSFLRMEKVEVEDIRNNQVYVVAEAVFNNPNPVSGSLVDIDLNVVVNEVDMGKVRQDTAAVIPANSEFIVPVKINFPIKKAFSNKKGLLKGVLSALIDKKADVHYEGKITLNFMKVNFDVPVDHDVELQLK